MTVRADTCQDLGESVRPGTSSASYSKDTGRHSYADSDRSTEIIEVEIETNGRTDLKGLLAYLDELQLRDIELLEAVYIGNKWLWQGMITFEHYGFVFPTSAGEFLTLDFGRSGIVWDVFDDYPDHPDNTFLVQRYSINNRRVFQTLRKYIQETKPFIFLIRDCQTWCLGLQKELEMENIDEPLGRNAKDRSKKLSIAGFVSCI